MSPPHEVNEYPDEGVAVSVSLSYAGAVKLDDEVADPVFPEYPRYEG